MTLACQVLPGKTYMLTRRVTRRHWLLRPDADGTSQQIYLYTLGYNANQHGILVHNLCQMSSHDHETITDVLGTLPLFLEGFHRDLANAM
ncbi:MAG: transposase, partial [Myxococcales bacterium]|nr:transposase [Myxococcales bacterium]